MLQWIILADAAQLNLIKEKSYQKPQVLYKHSTRCSVSSVSLKRIEKSEIPVNADFYFLDLIRFRNISDKVANDFNVYHESPQVLLIKNGECIYDESHLGINMQELAEQAA
ncbi:MAG TPA: bacillithiol system redox-active protein YtxJ [Panacibacter sp.]|nr:bacillithiol system redox-active protein YtxJ [Panacibacter sp.]